MAANHVIFIRGGKTHETHPWMFFHLDPKYDFAVTGVPSSEYGVGSFLTMKPSYKLSYLDFPEGKLQVWNQWTPKRGENAKPKKPDHESDLEPTIHPRQSDMSIDKSKKLPSVLSLYNYVKQQPKGSVVSLQVFSHGDDDELVIWRDSHEDIDIDKDDLTLPRDLHDTEFRRRDFFGNNPLATGAGGRRFAEAFSPQAFVKLWGCDYNSDHFTLIKRAGENPSNVLEKFKQLARLSSYMDVVDTLYPLLLARRIRVPVWAAPLGWGTTPWLDKRTYTGKFPPQDLAKEWWWSVPNIRNKYLRILRDRLGVGAGQIDATRYLKYSGGWMKRARDDLAKETVELLTTIGRGLDSFDLSKLMASTGSGRMPGAFMGPRQPGWCRNFTPANSDRVVVDADEIKPSEFGVTNWAADEDVHHFVKRTPPRCRVPRAITKLVMHESAPSPVYGIEQQRNHDNDDPPKGVHFAIHRGGSVYQSGADGAITQHNDVTDALNHAKGHNSDGIGVEIANQVTTTREPDGETIIEAKWPFGGRTCILPTKAQCESASRLIECLTQLPVLHGLPLEWPGLHENDGILGFQMTGYGESNKDAPGIRAHGYTGHSDGFFIVLYMWLRLSSNGARGQTAGEAWEAAVEIAKRNLKTWSPIGVLDVSDYR